MKGGESEVKAMWCLVVLVAIRLVMEMMVQQAAPLWNSYDITQKTLFVSLLMVFTIIGMGVVILGVMDLRRESVGRKIRVH